MDCIGGYGALWWTEGAQLRVIDPGGPRPTITTYSRQSVPEDLSAAFSRACRAAGLRRRLRLELVADAAGSAGFFVPGLGVPGLVVLGESDIRRLADWIFAGPNILRTDRRSGEALRSLGATVFDRRQLYRFVRGRIMRHELGHAFFHETGIVAPFPDDEEASADFFAGQLDAIDGIDAELGEIVFHAIGCREAACTHPPPAERASAYADGYQYQAIAEAAG